MFDGLDPLTCAPGELLTWASDQEPGPLVLSLLMSIKPDDLTPDEALTYIQVHERVSAWWGSMLHPAMVAAADPAPRVDEYLVLVPHSDEERVLRIEDAAREEVAAAARWSPATAQSRIDCARLLTGALSDTGAAQARGEITAGHVTVIVEAARRLPGFWRRDDRELAVFEDACRELQARVLPAARRGTLSATRRACARALLAIDAAGEARRRECAKATRDVWVSPDVDGMSLLVARMATEQAIAAKAQIDADAHLRAGAAAPGSVLTIGEQRVEALAAMVLGGDRSVSPSDGPSVRAQVRAHVNVTIDLETLLELQARTDDHDVELRGTSRDTSRGTSRGTAELTGYGPVPGSVVRDLFMDPNCTITLRRLLTDPITGHLLDYGRTTYQIPAALRDHVIARDKTCRFPGCTRRAQLCQIDHACAWDDGGATSPQNLGALCTRHHQLKTVGGWDVTESRIDGGCTWRSPEGRVYEHVPEPILSG